MTRPTWALAPALALTLTTAAHAQHDHGAQATAEPPAKPNTTPSATHAEAGASTLAASAQTHGGMVMGAGGDTWSTRPAPMLMPIRTMLPGTWALPGAVMIMGNVHGLLTNPGFARAQDRALGRTHPYLVNDWVMARARTSDGWLEGMLIDRWGVTTTVGLHGQLMWMNAAAHGGRGRH